jgi:hypothetical protein
MEVSPTMLSSTNGGKEDKKKIDLRRSSFWEMRDNAGCVYNQTMMPMVGGHRFKYGCLGALALRYIFDRGVDSDSPL